jgi:hypothetical protein
LFKQPILKNKIIILLYIFVFCVGTGLRVYPELLSSYPAGTDTPFYAYELTLLETKFDWDVLYFGNPMAYFVITFLKLITRINYLTLLKVVNPVLNGFVAISFLYFLKNGLKWQSNEKSLFVVLLLLFSRGGIIMSNGIIKQQFALFFFFFFLTFWLNKEFKKSLLFLVLIFLSHQLISILVFGILLFDFLHGIFIHKNFNKKTLFMIVVVVFGVFLITFLLPAVSSPDIFNEVWMHVKLYVTSNEAYGYSFSKTPLVERMVSHFNWYFHPLFSVSVTVGLLFYLKNKTINSMLFILLLFSFMPVGVIFGRWQFLLTYPFVIVATLGWFRIKDWLIENVSLTYPNKRVFKVLFGTFLCVILAFTVLDGVYWLTNENWSMARSSVKFEEVENIKEANNFICSRLGSKNIVIVSAVTIGWINFLFLERGINPSETNIVEVFAYRTITFVKNSSGYYMFRGGSKGHYMYIYKKPEVWVNLSLYDNVFILKDSYFILGIFDEYWQYYEKTAEFGQMEMYELIKNNYMLEKST